MVLNLFCFLSPVQRGLSDTYSAPISIMFETTDTNWCAGAYTHEKFPNFHVGVLQTPKKLPYEAVFWVGCLLSEYNSNGTISGNRNHFGC